jgi:hypothetical protein
MTASTHMQAPPKFQGYLTATHKIDNADGMGICFVGYRRACGNHGFLFPPNDAWPSLIKERLIHLFIF